MTSGDSPRQLSSLSSSNDDPEKQERAATRRAYRMKQVELMERAAMGLVGLERQNSMKAEFDSFLQMERLNQLNSGKLATLPKQQQQLQQLQDHHAMQQKRRSSRFMGILRRNNSDDSLDNDEEEQ